MKLQPVLTGTLLLMGAGFLVANVRLALEYLQFRRRRALLVWPGPRPPYYTMTIAIGVVLGMLVIAKVLFLHRQAFGEVMMFGYYGYLVPLNRRIGRGFYEDGVWADTTFIPYAEVGGITWREGEHDVALILISRLRNLARRLTVPGDKYGAARRVLRDKIADGAIHFGGAGLDLGNHDGRDDV